MNLKRDGGEDENGIAQHTKQSKCCKTTRRLCCLQRYLPGNSALGVKCVSFRTCRFPLSRSSLALQQFSKEKLYCLSEMFASPLFVFFKPSCFFFFLFVYTFIISTLFHFELWQKEMWQKWRKWKSCFECAFQQKPRRERRIIIIKVFACARGDEREN